MSRGRGWSRALLFVGAAASLSANVRHSFIPPKPDGATAERWREYAAAYADYMPAPESVVWAALVVLAVWMSLEAIVRIRWDNHRVWGFLIKSLLAVTVFAVALYASYGHGASILEYAGEDKFVVMFGPLLPDGMMVLGTAGLLLDGLRGQDADTTRGPSLADKVRAMRETAIAVGQAAAGRAGDALDTVIAGNVHAPTRDMSSAKWSPGVLSPDSGLVQDTSVDKDAMVIPSGVQDMSQDKSAVPTVSDVQKDVDAGHATWVGQDAPDTALDMDTTWAASVSKAVSGGKVSWDKDAMTAALPTGTDAELADKFGVSYKTVQRHRRDIVTGLIKDTVDTDEQIAARTGSTVRRVAATRRAIRAELGLS